MQTYDPAKTSVVGWGQVLQQFFQTDSVQVNNKAVSGTSSKSFYQSYWPKMVDAIEPGDVVIIQFAHNDEKSSGEDGDSLYVYYLSKGDSAAAAAQERRGTSPYKTFRAQLRTYINEVKARGAHPIIASSICRATIGSDGHVSRSGRHDLGGSVCLQIQGDTLVKLDRFPVTDHTMDYVWNAEQTALEYDDVPYIDLTTPTDSLWCTMGEAYCAAKIFPAGDRTHPMELGSTLVAQCFVEAVRAGAAGAEPDSLRRAVLMNMADDLREYQGLSWTPTELVADTVYSSTEVNMAVRLTGFDMDSLTGNVRVQSRRGSMLSTNGTNYATSLTIPYEQHTLLSTLQVRYTPHLNDPSYMDLHDTVLAIYGTDTLILPITYPVRAIHPEEGIAVSLSYPLATNQQGVVQGVGNVPGVRLEGLKHYKFYDVASGSPMWYLIRTNTDTKSWPGGESDICDSRYVELVYEAPDGLELHLDTLHLNLSMTSSGSQMCAKVYYSLKEDFSDAQYACGYEHLVSWRDHYVGAPIDLVLQPGQRLYVRVYPWLDATEETPNRWFCLSKVTVEGRALERIPTIATGIQIGEYWYKLNEKTHTAQLTYRGPESTSYRNQYQGEVYIPDTVVFRGESYRVRSISRYTFRTSTANLTGVHLPACIEEIEELAFYAARPIRSLTVDPANPVYDSRRDCNAIIETATHKLVQACLTTVIPDDVLILGQSCFNTQTITEITIPNSVVSIQNYAFFGTTLKKAEIPASVRNIGSFAFSNSRTLDSISVDAANTVYDSRDNSNVVIHTATNKVVAAANQANIPEGVVGIGYSAFYSKHAIRKLRLPASLEYIDPYGIRSCALLDTLDCYSAQPIRIDSTSVLDLSPRLVVVVNPGTKEQWEAERWWGRYTIVERAETPSDEHNTPTSVKDVEGIMLPKKVFVNGEIYIRTQNATYTPYGSRVR